MGKQFKILINKMEFQNSVSGFITELSADTLTKICGMLKLDDKIINSKV